MALIQSSARVAATVAREHPRRSHARGARQRVYYAPAERAEPWLRHFRCSARDLADAVKTVGSDPLDVGVYLERRV
jgi:hypothetical protein